MLNVRIDNNVYKDVKSVKINKTTLKYDNQAIWYIDVITKNDRYMAYCTNDFSKCVKWITTHCEEV